MTTIHKQPINTSNFSNYGKPKINQHFNTIIKEESKDQGMSFEKGEPALTFDVPISKEERIEKIINGDNEPESESNISSFSPAEERQERRASFKRAADIERRAQQEMKIAKEKISQASRVDALLQEAKKDPTAVARALGIEPTEFLRQYQNAMFNIPTTVEEKLSPEQELRQKLEKYEQERKSEKEQFLQMQSQTVRSNYIYSKILPVINQDSDKYELLNMNGKEKCAEFIYDMMDAHYRQTGEELSAQDVAEEMEEQLTKEYLQRIETTKTIKKFSKHFSTDTDAPGEELSLNSNQLGDEPLVQKRTSSIENQSKSSQLGETSINTRDTVRSQGPTQRISAGGFPLSKPEPSQLLGTQDNSYQRQAAWDRKRESRINKIEEFAKKNNITKNM